MSQNSKIAASLNGNSPTPPNPEVIARAKRRTFTVTYKQRILEEAEQCERGQIGALLRREGLYSSHLSKWRQQRRDGELHGLGGKKRGRNPKSSAAEKEIIALRQENGHLRAQVEQAELIITAQKKLSLALEKTLMPNADGTL